MDYRMYTATATANEDIVKLILKELEEEGKKFPNFKIHFIGFEATVGTKFKMNGNSLKVPSTGNFITPYDGERYWNITSFSFDEGCSNQDIYYII